jgi:hypothetical protein
MRTRRALCAGPEPTGTGGRRQEDEAKLAALESFVDLGRDVVARLDLPAVEPGVDAVASETSSERLDLFPVDPPLAAEDLHRIDRIRLRTTHARTVTHPPQSHGPGPRPVTVWERHDV